MERAPAPIRSRLATAAAIAWLLVGLVVTARDPFLDPGAGALGASLMGLALGLWR